ncbi:glucosamine-6-phosphate deaminase [Halobacillus sp. Marseille-Q1614]|uniref:glucosamine-6-phosphate deaminase n=1 Tax=Halobacillus sp. Marseille-Q1614 TaxID=2709134 RepID=UPI001570757F|nr:glucosamine-6-phosphate deaminase [Halobacillus sp. Marseille-Q1614]
MNLIETVSYEEMSIKAAEIIFEKVKNKPASTLGLATGGTPLGTYRELINIYNKERTSFQHLSTINLDEYVGLADDHPQSYHMYMHEHLFKYLDIPASQTHLPDGLAKDLDGECARYDKLIEQLGGVDLQLLGIGQNGHIGFNEPGTLFNTRTHVETLTESTRKANARYFSNQSDVPTHAITMGIQSIFQSREILLLASGIKKAEAIRRLIEGDVTEDFPASILKNHANLTVIADREALSKSTI